MLVFNLFNVSFFPSVIYPRFPRLPFNPPTLPIPSPHLNLWTEIHKNVISPLEGDTKEHVLQQKHTELKEKMRDLNHGFERLRKISHEGFTEDSGEETKTPAQLVTFHISVSLLVYPISLITGICILSNTAELWLVSVDMPTDVLCFQFKIE